MCSVRVIKLHGLLFFTQVRIYVAVLTILIKNSTLVRVFAKPVNTVIHDEVGMRILDSLVLIVDLVFLLKHDE